MSESKKILYVSERGPGAPPVTHLEFLVVHTEFLKSRDRPIYRPRHIGPTGPRREILSGGIKTDTGPPYFVGPSSKLVACLYINQNQLSCYDLQID